MRPATVNDLAFMNLVSEDCGLPALSDDVLERCIGYIGDHGYFILDMQDSTNAIVHTAITSEGRGVWGAAFFKAFLRWAFTSTRLERINAFIPVGDRHVKRFGIEAGMRVVHTTLDYVYLDIDLFRWMAWDDGCLQGGGSDYARADQEMVRRVIGACAMMSAAGMEHKAWYIYELYAKLFGYKVEA